MMRREIYDTVRAAAEGFRDIPARVAERLQLMEAELADACGSEAAGAPPSRYALGSGFGREQERMRRRAYHQSVKLQCNKYVAMHH
jgi:hypothetical protein